MIDIGANLTDPMFKGQYNGKTAHHEDLDLVLERAFESGVSKIIITGGSLEESREALQMATSRGESRLYCTVGVHPTRCQEFESDPEGHMSALCEVIEKGGDRVVAVGECGLDFDRLQFCPEDTQIKWFQKQFELADRFKLNMFLHNRNTNGAFFNVVSQNRDRFGTGVVHSFTGDLAEMQQYIDLGLYIGINGCSLKTAENLDVVKSIPIDRIVLETDAPWCDIRPSHAGYRFIQTRRSEKKKERFERGHMVKGRNEPCNLRQVAEVVAAVLEVTVEELNETVLESTNKLFFSS
eukprot:GILK01004598.1.p1 GENE.GILK01004598.1~~GILK01004598.1.p1  ORF type:complete len:295 (+),score=47.75 GILK01004598.1:45-929(+)